MSNAIRLFVPATVANVGSGFDILGFALEQPGDEVEIKLKDSPGITIINNSLFPNLPTDPEQNTAGISMLAFLQHINSSQGFEINIIKKIKPGSGLGSSAASAVAGVFAANELLGSPLKKEDLLPFAMEGERHVTGVAHADNVGPALLGGFILIRSYTPLDIIKIPCPDELYCSVVHPQIEVRTEDARKILKQMVTLKDAITQWGNVGGLIAGLMRDDYELIGRSLEDVIIEPIRSVLIPGFNLVKKAALDSGGLGCSISGSGPSVFALCKSKHIAEIAAAKMKEVFDSIEIPSERHVSAIGTTGPKILE